MTFLENFIVKFPIVFTLEIVISIGGSVGFHAADDEVSLLATGSAFVKMRLIFRGATARIDPATAPEN